MDPWSLIKRHLLHVIFTCIILWGQGINKNSPVNSMISKIVDQYVLQLILVFFSHVPRAAWTIVEFFLDICFFWVRRIYQFYVRKDPLREKLKELKAADNYSQWKQVAIEIDQISEMEYWRRNAILNRYDYMLIDERTKLLRRARINEDLAFIMSLFRSGLIRNFGGIAQKKLFTKSYVGTKYNIEEYIAEVLRCLDFLQETLSNPIQKEEGMLMNSKQLKLDFFHDARQSFGCTALLLQGGSLFGLCHMGVVKALYFKGLLPRIIAGSAVGAAVASIACSLTHEELSPILISPADVLGDIDRLNHDVDERYGNVIENVVKKGYSQDILIFLKFVRDTIGDLTFEEAFIKTDKILNIVIHPSHQSVPNLLNYITAPNVIIWTAIYASIGTGVLSDNVKLYVKDFKNRIVPRQPDIDVTFLKPQEVNYLQNKASNRVNHQAGLVPSDKYSPYTRLTELFNVNHFIVSLARPYLAPLISNDLSRRSTYYSGKKGGNGSSDQSSESLASHIWKNITNVVGLEIQHRLAMMNKLGMLSDTIKRLCIDERPSTPLALASTREITIVPELGYLLRDFGRVFDVHKTLENIPYWILVGEKSVWPLFSMLSTRCSIEFALEDLYNLHQRRT